MNERWKNLKNYEGIYQISDAGRIWSVKKQKYLRPQENGNGYKIVFLTKKDGTTQKEYVHRLVAMAFIENPARYPQVNHIDGDKTNNNAANLEWCTAQYNIWHSRNVLGRSRNQREVVCLETEIIYPSIAAAERLTGDRLIWFVVNDRTKMKKNNYHWKYAD